MKRMIFSSLAAMLLVPGLAAAQEAGQHNELHWVSGTLTIAEYSDKDKSEAKKGESILTLPDAAGGTYFYCIEETLGAYVTAKPTDLRDAISTLSFRSNARTVEMHVNGEMVYSSFWAWYPNKDLLQPLAWKARSKLYNAVIRQDEVILKMTGHDPVEVKLPPVNEAFKDFGGDCGLGRNAKKD